MAVISVTLGNTSVVEARDISVDVTPSRVRVPRPDLGKQETRFEIPEGYGSIEDLAANPEHAAKMAMLPRAQRAFYPVLIAIEDAWWSAHSNAFPEWVEVEGGARALGELLAASFTTGKHTCKLGRPRSWEASPTPEDREAASAAALASALEEIGP